MHTSWRCGFWLDVNLFAGYFDHRLVAEQTVHRNMVASSLYQNKMFQRFLIPMNFHLGHCVRSPVIHTEKELPLQTLTLILCKSLFVAVCILLFEYGSIVFHLNRDVDKSSLFQIHRNATFISGKRKLLTAFCKQNYFCCLLAFWLILYR